MTLSAFQAFQNYADFGVRSGAYLDFIPGSYGSVRPVIARWYRKAGRTAPKLGLDDDLTAALRGSTSVANLLDKMDELVGGQLSDADKRTAEDVVLESGSVALYAFALAASGSDFLDDGRDFSLRGQIGPVAGDRRLAGRAALEDQGSQLRLRQRRALHSLGSLVGEMTHGGVVAVEPPRSQPATPLRTKKEWRSTMFARNVFGLALAGLLSIAPAAVAAETTTVDIVSVRGGGSYVEIVTSKAACTTGSVDPDWADRPRISYDSNPEQAESVQNLAIAALLSGRSLKIKATTSGSHCLIEAVWLVK